MNLKEKKEEKINSDITASPETAPKNNAHAKRMLIFAFSGGIGGLLLMIVGFSFLVAYSFEKNDTLLDEIGTALLILSYPLLFLGGHFLDKAKERSKESL